MNADLPRRVGFWGAIAVMVGIIIGSGIFRTPTQIAAELDSPGIILLLWGAGGLISLFGALTYAELASMFPASGGVYVFLREGFGRAVCFVFGWTYLLITKPLAAAGIAIIFGEHVLRLAGIERPPPTDVAGVASFVQWSKLVTVGCLVALTVVNVRGVRLGAGLAMVLTLIKALALAMIVVLGLALAQGASSAPAAAPGAEPAFQPKPLYLALAPVMAAIMWTYDGWSDVGAIAGEVRNPQRNLLRIYLTGTLAVTCLYLAVNAVYMRLMPLSEMRTVSTVAPTVMGRLLGEGGALVITALVVISTLGSTHGSILTGARISYAQARDGLLFSFLGRVHPRYETPAISLWVQLLLSCAATLFVGDFESLAGGFVFTMWIFYGLAALAIFILRVRRPDLPRPYRCWGYPVVPALFVLSAAAMTVLPLLNPAKRAENLMWLGVLLAGFPVYAAWRALVPPPRPDGAPPAAPGPGEP